MCDIIVLALKGERGDTHDLCRDKDFCVRACICTVSMV